MQAVSFSQRGSLVNCSFKCHVFVLLLPGLPILAQEVFLSLLLRASVWEMKAGEAVKQTRQQGTQQAGSDEPLQPLLTIADVSRMLHLSRPKIYDLIYTEGLPIMRFGRVVRVSPVSLERWLVRRERTA